MVQLTPHLLKWRLQYINQRAEEIWLTAAYRTISVSAQVPGNPRCPAVMTSLISVWTKSEIPYLGIIAITAPKAIQSHASIVDSIYSTTQNGFDGASQSTQVAPSTEMKAQKQTTLAMFDTTNGQCYKTKQKVMTFLVSKFSKPKPRTIQMAQSGGWFLLAMNQTLANMQWDV